MVVDARGEDRWGGGDRRRGVVRHGGRRGAGGDGVVERAGRDRRGDDGGAGDVGRRRRRVRRHGRGADWIRDVASNVDGDGTISVHSSARRRATIRVARVRSWIFAR